MFHAFFFIMTLSVPGATEDDIKRKEGEQHYVNISKDQKC